MRVGPARFAIYSFGRSVSNTVRKCNYCGMSLPARVAQCLGNEKIEEAAELLSSTEAATSDIHPDQYNETLEKLCVQNRSDIAVELQKKMIRRRQPVYPKVFCHLIQIITKTDSKLGLHKLRQMLRLGMSCDIKTFNSVMDAFCNEKNIEEAFNLISVAKEYSIPLNEDSYHAVVRCFLAREEYNDAIMVLDQMEKKNMIPKIETLKLLMKKCSEKRLVGKCSAIISFMRQMGMEIDVEMFNYFLRAFVASGQWENLQLYYDEMISEGITPNLNTFEMLVESYSRSQQRKRITQLIEQMKSLNVEPNENIIKWAEKANVFL